MTEAIDEQFEQQEKLLSLPERDFGDDQHSEKPIHNQYPDKTTKLDQDMYFGVPAKAVDFTLGGTSKENDSIQNSMNQSMDGDGFKIKNKNLENYINRMENRGKTKSFSKKVEEKEE
jgi:hypothetical protein